jgi:hypothetical protein
MRADLKVGVTKFAERSGNVYENKGSPFVSPDEIGNVYEKT